MRRILTSGILLAACAFAQKTSFPKPDYFRETFQSAQTRVELRDPVRLRDFVVDGKLELSLRHYLELVMANNTSVQIQLLTLEVPRNNILRAYGPWDPTARASFQTTRSTTVPTSPLDTSNVNSILKSLNQPYSLSYTQLLDTGTQYTAQFSGVKTSSSNSRSSYLKSLTANLNFNMQQPLLRNRGRYVNRIPLMTAQSNLKVSEFSLRSQLLTVFNTAEAAYWNLVSARENLRVQEKARDTQGEYLKYMQQQLDLGAISPLDIYNPQQSLAAAELQVSQAQFNVRSAEDTVRNQLAVDLDPEIRKLPIVLTEQVELGPAESLALDPEQEVSKALATNPSIKSATQRLDVDDLGIQSARNALLPNLVVNAGYTSNGLGGIFDPNRSSLVGSGVGALPLIPGGITDALGQMFGFGYPTYQAGLTLTLPIRNRAASADMANALVQKKSDSLLLRNQQQTVRLNVLRAVTSLEGSKEQLKLAIKQRDFAQKNVDAELLKYKLGTEINQNVIFAQQAFAQADLAVVNNQIGVRMSLLNLLTQTGELLDERGVVIK